MCVRLFALCLVLLLAVCDSPAEPDVGSVQIRPDTNLALLTATEFQLNAEVRRTDGSVSSGRVTWRSTTPDFATVDGAGAMRTATTYDPCWAIPVASTIRWRFCQARIIATAGARSDTLFILIKPRIVIHGTLSVSLTVGDSTRLDATYATIDGKRVCNYGFNGPTPFLGGTVGGVTWRNGHIVGLKPGEVTIHLFADFPHQCIDSQSTVITIQVTSP